jgi:hypothetical protein
MYEAPPTMAIPCCHNSLMDICNLLVHARSSSQRSSA